MWIHSRSKKLDLTQFVFQLPWALPCLPWAGPPWPGPAWFGLAQPWPGLALARTGLALASD